MVQWVGPSVIGFYLGVLIGPWLRGWIAEKEWTRQARGPQDAPRSESTWGRVSWSDYEWLANQPAGPSSETELPDDRP
ncbi:MAG: hypothetical protein M3P18_14140 [Actinomycetota bacterium]|nr:hypothetical protein [Actinomycetota bacterium]